MVFIKHCGVVKRYIIQASFNEKGIASHRKNVSRVNGNVVIQHLYHFDISLTNIYNSILAQTSNPIFCRILRHRFGKGFFFSVLILTGKTFI